MLLKDKVVIVSGIGPGLGIELAILSAKEGAKLAIAARTESKLQDAEEKIAALGLGTEVISVPTDISDKNACKNLVDKTVAKFGRVDVLLNSAYNPGAMELVSDVDLDGWRPAIDVNFFGTMQLTQYAVQAMKKQGGGAIVMINTMTVHKSMPTQAGYAASKAALAAATAHLAQEVGVSNIRVNSAYMGWMWGPSVEGYLQYNSQLTGKSVEELKADIEKNIPLGRIPDDADCAKAAIFLASDYASAMTGASLDVNGGEFIPH